MNFDSAFHDLLGHEGGYSNHPDDTGKETNWGITERVARANGYAGHMRDFPVESAKTIYRRDYWDAVKAEQLPAGIRYAVFDAAVNSGVTMAVKWLQWAVGAADDGIVGPQTIRMTSDSDPDLVVRRMLGARLNFMASLSTWPAFSRGWARRIAALLSA